MSQLPARPPADGGPAPRPVALVGMMGVGKTAVGRRLACHLDRPFVDLDAELVEREGRAIPEIFATDGEDRFRALESELLDESLDRADAPVVSTGGGVVKSAINREWLRNRAVTVWLRGDAATIVARVGPTAARPLLQPAEGESMVDLVERLMAERQDLYAEVAVLTMDTDHGSAHHLAGWLSDRLATALT
ncbi:MAG: shikimate kinase [Actinomycetia bacterium]|nr:shikimate kinase [Actinomycetes bacterium]MCP4086785.1 shikimate kinase [Actinomycetes bacterium]